MWSKKIENRYKSQHAGHLQGTFSASLAELRVRPITPITVLIGILEAENYLPMHQHVPSKHGLARTFASSSQILGGLQLKPLGNIMGSRTNHARKCAECRVNC